MILEYRIPLPINTEDFQVGQLYMVIKAQEAATGGGEGVLVLKNEPFDNRDGHQGESDFSGVQVPKLKGQYTLKHYLLASKVPGVVKALIKPENLIVIEEAWNAHPYCLTVWTCPALSKEKFSISIESRYFDDYGDQENAMGLSPSDLKKREVIFMDIADNSSGEKVPDNESGMEYHSEKRNFGPLKPGFYKETPKHMCCYKLVGAHFRYFGLQTIVENIIRNQQMALFKKTMRQLVCSTDEWDGLTLEDIRRMEEENKKKLDDKIKTGEISELLKDEAK